MVLATADPEIGEYYPLVKPEKDDCLAPHHKKAEDEIAPYLFAVERADHMAPVGEVDEATVLH